MLRYSGMAQYSGSNLLGGLGGSIFGGILGSARCQYCGK